MDVGQVGAVLFPDVNTVARKTVHRLPRPDQKGGVVPPDVQQDGMKLLQGHRHDDSVVVKADSGNKETEQNHRRDQGNQTDPRRPDRLQLEILGHPSKHDQGRDQDAPRHREGQRLGHQQADHLEDEGERHLIIHQQFKDLLESVAQHDDER